MKKIFIPANSEYGGVVDSYRYITEKSQISLVRPSILTHNMFEIYCLDGNLFKGPKRYGTLEEAEKYIEEIIQE